MPRTVHPSDLLPVRNLPASIAEELGALIARHAYLDWLLGQVMYDLMEISTKQGRVMLMLPRPRQYVAAILHLFEFHGLPPAVDLDALARRLETADRSRNVITRSVYMRAKGAKSEAIHLSRSAWDPGPGAESQPDTQPVDGAFFAKRRKDVEEAVRAAEKLHAKTDELLRALYEKRRKSPRWNRRK